MTTRTNFKRPDKAIRSLFKASETSTPPADKTGPTESPSKGGHNDKPSETPSSPGTGQGRRGTPAYRRGIREADLELLKQYAEDMTELVGAVQTGDHEVAQEIYPRMLRLPRQASRLKDVARRARRRVE